MMKQHSTRHKPDTRSGRTHKITPRHQKKVSKISRKTSVVHKGAKRTMWSDPLGTEEHRFNLAQDEAKERTAHQWASNRNIDDQLVVLLAGYNSFFAQHLYSHLVRQNFVVIPVATAQANEHRRVQVLTYDQITEHGIPDVDFIINASGVNPYSPLWDTQQKTALESSKLDRNKLFADQIRKTRTKPYAYLNISSALYYPPSHNNTYTEFFELPSTPLPDEIERPELQAQELSLPYLSRLFRDSENAARTFIPELDYRTPEQLEEYRTAKREFLQRSAAKYDLGGSTSQITPDQLRAASTRRDLLENSDVRNISLRLGHLLCKDMQELLPFKHRLNYGLGAPIGDHIQPWIHVDDACNMAIWALTNSNVSGPVNAVAPNLASNARLFEYVKKANGLFSNPFVSNISRGTIEKIVGKTRSTAYIDQRVVEPAIAKMHGFEWEFPTVSDAMESGTRSLLEREIYAAGGNISNIWRNRHHIPHEGLHY